MDRYSIQNAVDMCQTILDALKAESPANGGIPANLGTTNTGSPKLLCELIGIRQDIECGGVSSRKIAIDRLNAVIEQLRAGA